MLRINGIPARLVGGYRGGYYNDVGQYYIVPQKYAHAWVEAYVKPKGWVRLDPTPAALDSFASLASGGNFLKFSILMEDCSRRRSFKLYPELLLVCPRHKLQS